MKKIIHFVLLLIIFVGCSPQKKIAFTGDAWSYDTCTSTVVNADTTIRFTFGEGLHDIDTPLYYSAASLGKHPRLASYLSDILRAARLEGSRIMLYAPLENVVFVELPQDFQNVTPNAISFNLNKESPYTAWNWDCNNIEEYNRQTTDMNTNSYTSRNWRRIIIVDKFTYDDKPIARISILQSNTKKANKIGLPATQWTCPCDVTDLRNIIPVSNWVEGIRNVSFSNYKLGQQIKQIRADKRLKADLAEIIRADQEPRNRITAAWSEHPSDTLLHRSIAKAILRADSINLIKVCNILDSVGFVGKDRVGEECIALWLVIQHSPLEYQQKYLPMFKVAAINGDLPKDAIALMEDRIAIRLGHPQIYGSQGNINKDGIFVPAEMLDPENVDKRREEMGLPPLSQYIEAMSRQ